MSKVIVTIVGQDQVGIIAKVCTYLANHSINILDISQTITGGYFNMMTITDVTKASVDFATLSKDLEELGKTLGVIIHCQREDIFSSMHRI